MPPRTPLDLVKLKKLTKEKMSEIEKCKSYRDMGVVLGISATSAHTYRKQIGLPKRATRKPTNIKDLAQAVKDNMPELKKCNTYTAMSKVLGISLNTFNRYKKRLKLPKAVDYRVRIDIDKLKRVKRSKILTCTTYPEVAKILNVSVGTCLRYRKELNLPTMSPMADRHDWKDLKQKVTDNYTTLLACDTYKEMGVVLGIKPDIIYLHKYRLGVPILPKRSNSFDWCKIETIAKRNHVKLLGMSDTEIGKFLGVSRTFVCRYKIKLGLIDVLPLPMGIRAPFKGGQLSHAIDWGKIQTIVDDNRPKLVAMKSHRERAKFLRIKYSTFMTRSTSLGLAYTKKTK